MNELELRQLFKNLSDCYADTGERQLTISDVIKAEGEPLPDDWGCGDIPLPNDYVKISTTKIVKGNGL